MSTAQSLQQVAQKLGPCVTSCRSICTITLRGAQATAEMGDQGMYPIDFIHSATRFGQSFTGPPLLRMPNP